MKKIDKEQIERLPPAKQQEVLKRLELMKEYRRVNPLYFFNHPSLSSKPVHQKQMDWINLQIRIKAIFGGNQCILPNVKVKLASGGSRAICDIEVGDKVLGVNLDGTTVPVDVTDKFENGIKQTYDWKFKDNISFQSTNCHNVLTKTGEILPIGLIQKKNSLARTLGFEPISLDNENEEFAMLFGLLLGDGSIYKTVGGRKCVFYNQDEDIINLFEREVSLVGGLYSSKRAFGHFAISHSNKNTHDAWFLDLLERYGMNVHAHEKFIPDIVFSWSNDAVAKLLSGLILTDGWLTENSNNNGQIYGQCGIQLTSKIMIEQIKELFRDRFGIYTSNIKIRKYEKDSCGDAYTICVNDLNSLKRLSNILTLVGVKKEKLETFSLRESFKESDNRFLKIRDIENIGEEYTFDIEVDHPTHLFMLDNGLVVSNSGKTTAAIADCLIQAHDEAVLPKHLLPAKKWKAPFKCRIFTPDLSDTMYIVQQKVKDLVCHQQLLGDSWDSAYNKVERILRFKNGSFFQFMSYDQDLQKLGSATLHRIYYDEEPPYKVFEECQPRLMRYGGDQVFAMTPLQGMTWMHKDIWQKSGGDDTDLSKWKFVNEEAKVASVIIDMDDNPYLTKENKEDTLSTYSQESLRARKEGRFVHFAGLIYTEFSEKDHVVPQREEKPYSRHKLVKENKQANIIVGIDPGLRFTAVEWVALDEDQNMTVFNELFVSDWTIQEVCKQIHMENAFHNVKPAYYIIDPHARDRSKQTGRSDQYEFTKAGIYTILGQNDVQTGIDAVKQRLKDGKLEIQSNCENLIREFKIYRYKEPSKRVEQEISAEPIKKDDHCLDCLRYIIMSRPYAPELEIKDERTWEEKWMDADKANASIQEVSHEFGGGVFI